MHTVKRLLVSHKKINYKVQIQLNYKYPLHFQPVLSLFLNPPHQFSHSRIFLENLTLFDFSAPRKTNQKNTPIPS